MRHVRDSGRRFCSLMVLCPLAQDKRVLLFCMPALMISAGLNEATAGAALHEPFDSVSVAFNVQTSDQRRPVNTRLHFYQFVAFQGHDMVM